jgi:PAS domain S-box-containing protein
MATPFWQRCFDLSVRIGPGVSLQGVLQSFLEEWQRQFDSSACAAFFLKNASFGRRRLHSICQIPSSGLPLEAFRQAVQGLPQDLLPGSWERYRQELPMCEPIQGRWAVLFEVTGFGLILSVQEERWPETGLSALSSLGAALGAACANTLRLNQLQEAKSQLTESNKVLREKSKEMERSRVDLSSSELKYRKIFENIHDVFFQADRDGIVVEINPAIFRLTGLPREQLLGKGFGRMFLDGEKAESFRRKLLHSGELMDYEILLFSRHGSPVHGSINARVLYGQTVVDVEPELGSLSPAPRAVLGFEGTIRDISERKLAEQKVQTLNQRLATILEHLQAAILVEDGAGKTILVNQGYQRMFRLGSNINALLRKPPPSGTHLAHCLVDPAGYDALMRQLRSSEQAVLGARLALRDGQLVECDYIPIPDEGGAQRSGIVWQFRDVTEAMRSAEQLQAAREQAERASKAKSEFLANMSHEIRTPLNAIIGFAELLEGRQLSPDEQQFISAIAVSGRNLLRLINDILDLSKIEAGGLELHPDPVDLRLLFQEILGVFEWKAKTRKISLTLEIAEQVPPALFLDETRFRQILFNLIGNAMKFTEQGQIGVRVLCERRTATEAVDLRVEIADTGIGIAEDQLGLIFRTYLQQKGQDDRKYMGTGLGLSITKRLVEAMGGAIGVFSSPGAGSVFSFSIPNLTPASLQASDASTGESLSRFAAARVLLVEDNPTNARLVEAFLEEFGLNSRVLPTGEDVVEQVKSYRPTLVLMDLHLPVVDGWAATRALRQESQTAKVPIVAVTADGLASRHQEAFEAGVDALITKPFTKLGLNKVLGRFLKIREPQESEKDSGMEISNSLRLERLVPVLEQLSGELARRRKDLMETMLVQDIRAFAAEVVSLAQEAGFDFLSQWGRKLQIFADQFQIEELAEGLAQYDSLLVRAKGVSGTALKEPHGDEQ